MQRLLDHDWLPYVAPFGAYMGLLMVQTVFAMPVPWAYPVRTIAAALLLWAFRKRYGEITFHCSPLAGVIGLLAIVIWIGIDPWYPHLSTLLVCGALYTWLYCVRKDLFACVLAHAVSNALLAVWVVVYGDWKFW